MTPIVVAIERYKILDPHNAKVISISGYGTPENNDIPPRKAMININIYEFSIHIYSVIFSAHIRKMPIENNKTGNNANRYEYFLRVFISFVVG